MITVILAAALFSVSPLITTLLISNVLPAIVALVTKLNASPWIKQAINALLSAITGMIVTATTITGAAVIGKDSVLLALGSFFASQVSYLALYKTHDANAKIAPSVGLG
jgi:hypothetical protein